MSKLFLTTLGFLFFSTNVLAQQMKEKRVCNTLENGAEFCTVFKVPVDNKPRKTADEINQELAKQSELVFNKKEEKKFRSENKPQKVENDLIEVVDEVPTNREVKYRANKKEELRQKELALQKEAEEAQIRKQERELAKKRLEEEARLKKQEEEIKAKKLEEEVRKKEFAKKKLEKEEQLKAKKKEAEIKRKEKELAKKKLEEEASKKEMPIEKEASEEKKVEKPVVQQEQQSVKSKPTFKDKENFSNFLSTIKNLE